MTEEQLQQVVAGVARVSDPKRLILFGSQARGTAGEGSDIDLLVIHDRYFGPTRSRRREAANIRRGIPPLGIPIDVVVFNAEEVEHWKDTTNHVISVALREGRVIYERP